MSLGYSRGYERGKVVGNLDIEKYLKVCTFLVDNADVGSANANKVVLSTAATVCPTTTPSKKRKPATNT